MNVATVVDVADPTDEPMQARPGAAAIWRALHDVPDPEIPIVSIVELGIVRGFAWRGDVLHVAVTPTYSGCPATDVIRDDIRAAMRRLHIRESRIDMTLSPPWSTDWIAPEAKDKLLAFGIVPPGAVQARVNVAGISPLRKQSRIACPRCGSTDTSLLAQFGSTACKALYRCESCREPFDYFKPL